MFRGHIAYARRPAAQHNTNNFAIIFLRILPPATVNTIKAAELCNAQVYPVRHTTWPPPEARRTRKSGLMYVLETGFSPGTPQRRKHQNPLKSSLQYDNRRGVILSPTPQECS